MGNRTIKPYMIVGWKKYFNSSNSTINVYLKKYGLKFIEQTFLKIKRAHLTKKPYISLIKFNDDETISLIYQNEYQSALKLLLNLCIQIEYYELCSDIEKCITMMDKRKRRNVIRANKMVLN